MRPKFSLALEHLEDRCVPATFGNPWPDGSHITLSFAPDGTNISGTASNLSVLTSGNLAARDAILGAFQNWAANANINLGLVSDNGDAFDVAGAVQGDSRFGDIRVGGRAWASDVLALTTPFNYFNTQSGNVALNTAASLTVGGANGTRDLFTVMLQESGHSLGIGNSPDLGSVMYEYYQGVRTGLSAADIASIQALYGARKQDLLEGLTGNNSFATATAYSGALTADLTTSSDVDYYRFNVDPTATSVTVRLKAAGLSMVQSNVQVLDASGQVVALAAAQDAAHNDITLVLSNLNPFTTYYVRVAANRGDVFGVGSYQLSIDGTTAIATTAPVATTEQVSGSFSTFDSAAVLTSSVASVDQQLDYAVQVAPEAQATVNYFRVHAPSAAADQTVHLVAAVAGLDSGQEIDLAVFDVNQNRLEAKVLTDCTGSAVIQVDNVQPNADYFVRVETEGAYNLTVDFTASDIPFTLGSTGSVATTQSATLTVSQSQMVQFVLTAGDGDGDVTMTISDANGLVVCMLAAEANSSRSVSVFLATGTYHVEMSSTLNGASLTYTLSACTITDPIGALPTDPTGTPVGSTPPPTTTTPPPDEPTISWTADDPSQGSLWF